MTRDYSMFLVVFYVFYYAFCWVTCSVLFHFHAYSYFLAFECLWLCFYGFLSFCVSFGIVLFSFCISLEPDYFLYKTMLLMVFWVFISGFRLPRIGLKGWSWCKDQRWRGWEWKGLRRNGRKEARTKAEKEEKGSWKSPLKRWTRTALAVTCWARSCEASLTQLREFSVWAGLERVAYR